MWFSLLLLLFIYIHRSFCRGKHGTTNPLPHLGLKLESADSGSAHMLLSSHEQSHSKDTPRPLIRSFSWLVCPESITCLTGRFTLNSHFWRESSINLCSSCSCSSPTFLLMDGFVGTWTLTGSDNFDEYMKAIGGSLIIVLVTLWLEDGVYWCARAAVPKLKNAAAQFEIWKSSAAHPSL